MKVQLQSILVIASLLAAPACSGPQTPPEGPAKSVGSTAPDAGTAATNLADASSGDTELHANPLATEFPFTVAVKRHNFTILGPTDIIERSDGRAYVLLASAQGTRTGRPMAIVDLESGAVQQTSAVPIPLSKPYGMRLPDDDLFVVNQSRPKDQSDMVYVDVVFYDSSADLWHVVPLPSGELVDSAGYTMTPDGPELTLYEHSGNTTYLFDQTNRSWTETTPPTPEGCMTSRYYEGSLTWAIGLSAGSGEVKPCAALYEGDTPTAIPVPPSPRCLHEVLRTSTATWLIGGYDRCGSSMLPTSDKVDLLPDGASEWTRLPALPVRVFPAGTAVVDDAMLIFDQSMAVMTWVESQKKWAAAMPVEDMQNNSDWVPVGPNRVATLAWRKDGGAKIDEVVVYTFQRRSKITP